MPGSCERLFAPHTQHGAPPIYDQGNLLTLALAHLGVVCCAAAASTLVAVGLRVLVTRPTATRVRAAAAPPDQRAAPLPSRPPVTSIDRLAFHERFRATQ